MSRRADLNLHPCPTRQRSLNQLRHSCVRDLAWCLTSPAIYQLSPGQRRSPDPFHNKGRLWHWLYQLDQAPEPLYQTIAQQRSHRIGIYFETLYGFALQQLLRPAQLHYALALRQQQKPPPHTPTQTLGEYDLLHRLNGSAGWCHTELSLKFYLGMTTPASHAGITDWVGLNRNDRLLDKRDKMLQKQLQLSDHPHARQQLQQLRIQISQRLGLICGRLFYPFDTPHADSPAGAQPNHLRGWWIRAGQQERLSQRLHNRDLLNGNNEVRLVTLSRRQWLAPLAPNDISTDAGSNGTAVGEGIEMTEPGQPEMVARLIQTPHGWREHDRGVLVPDRW